MLKKAVLQNKKTNEKKEFETELEFKNFLIWHDKNDEWEIIDIQLEQKPQANNKKTKSVGNGEGTQYYSDTLKCWIFQYYDTNGKRQTMKQRKKETVKDFKARVTKVKEELNTGTYICKSTETVVTIAKHHIELKHDDGTTSARSYGRDLSTLKQLEKTCSNFCYLPIQQVTIKHIEDAKKEIKTYSNSVIDKIWQMLHKIFKIACSPSRKILIYNIMEDVNLKKPISDTPSKKVKPLTKTECERLTHILDNEERNHKYRNILKLHLIAGSRIGETLARSEDDYNEENNTFNVWNTLTQDENFHVIWSEHTKTYNKLTGIDEGQRFLPLDSPIFSEIADIVKEEKAKKVKSINNVHNVLFWDYKNDTFITPKELNSWLDRLEAKYHILDKDDKENLTTHRIRHYTITHWAELGIPKRVIQYLAGHIEGSDITDDVYIDTSFDFVKDTLRKIS